MSLSAIGSIAPAVSLPQLQQATPAPTPAQPRQASLQPDTVSLSTAAQRPSTGGDLDHDGDSH